MTPRLCKRCGETKPLSGFHRNAASLGGRLRVCRMCISEKRARQTPRALRLRDARMLRGEGLKRCNACHQIKVTDDFPRNRAQFDGRGGACRPCNSAACLARQQADPEAYGERHKRWRDANAEHAAAAGRRGTSARRARVRGAFVEHVDPLVVLERDDGVCGICNEDVDPFAFDVDHCIPLAHGGGHSYANTRPAHPSCNRRRGRAVALNVS